MRTLTVLFEVRTNLTPKQIKAAVIDLINRGDLELENTLEDVAEIDATSVEGTS